MFAFLNNQLLKGLGDPISVVCVRMCDQRRPQNSGLALDLQKAWFLLSSLLLSFQTIQVVLRPREERLVPGREGGLVSKREEEKLVFNIPKHVWASVVSSKVGSHPFSETFSQVPSVQQNFMQWWQCPMSVIQCARTIRNFWALEVWLVELRNWVLTFKYLKIVVMALLSYYSHTKKIHPLT